MGTGDILVEERVMGCLRWIGPEDSAVLHLDVELEVRLRHERARDHTDEGTPRGDEFDRAERVVSKRGPVVQSASRYGLDPELVTAVLIVESGARPWARSRKGAVGLMQVMPYMVRDMQLAGNLATIESNVEAGCVILADNIRRLGEDDGISAYFWGSNIRGVAYLDRVRAARAQVRRLSES